MTTDLPPISSSSSIQSIHSSSSSSSDPPTLIDLSYKDVPVEATRQNPVPVTILSGFLGSGKTTLLQHILSSTDHNYKIAVIENEFGEGNLAIETLIARDGFSSEKNNLTDLIELPNGCVCCTVKDSLVETLEMLLQKRNDLDYIVIEASGMANPGPIAGVFWLDDALESRLRLDGVVTMVDAKNILGQLRETDVEGGEAARQIAFADRILLNKMDLLPCGNLQWAVGRVEERIRGINPTAPMVWTTFSRLENLRWVLGTYSFDKDRVSDVDDAFRAAEKRRGVGGHEGECGTDCSHHHSVFDHSHTSTVGTETLRKEGSVNLKMMHSWLAEILWPEQDKADKELRWVLDAEKKPTNNDNDHHSKDIEKGPLCQTMQIYRLKGILSVCHTTENCDTENLNGSEDVDANNTAGLDPRRYIVQAVNDLWEIHPANDSLGWNQHKPLEERSCKLVVIGRYLDYDLLEKGFNNCFQ